VKFNTHLHLVPRLKYVEIYLHSSMRFHDVVLTGVKILFILKRKSKFKEVNSKGKKLTYIR